MIIFALIFLSLLLLFPEIAITGSRYGLSLWLTQLFPTLFPFFVAIRLLDIGLPNVTEKKGFLLIGLLCGYPAGASLVMNQYEKRKLSKTQAYFYLGFVNNPSPAFVILFCGSSLLALSPQQSYFLFFLLILSSYLGSLFFYLMYKLLKKEKTQLYFPKEQEKTLIKKQASSLFASLDRIILDSFEILFKIGGYVILFSLLSQFLALATSSVSAIPAFCSGLLEITSGLSILCESTLPSVTKKILTMIILAFGGLSATAQTNSIIARSELSILPYILCKLCNGIVAGILSGLLFFYLI